MHEGRKRKNSKCVGMRFKAISSIFKFRHAPCLHDHVTGHVSCRHNFILETSCGAVNIRNSHFPSLRNLWRYPVGQSLDCAITGYKCPLHSHFSQPLATVNWPISPRRTYFPPQPHVAIKTKPSLNLNSQSPRRKTSKPFSPAELS